MPCSRLPLTIVRFYQGSAPPLADAHGIGSPADLATSNVWSARIIEQCAFELKTRREDHHAKKHLAPDRQKCAHHRSGQRDWRRYNRILATQKTRLSLMDVQGTALRQLALDLGVGAICHEVDITQREALGTGIASTLQSLWTARCGAGECRSGDGGISRKR